MSQRSTPPPEITVGSMRIYIHILVWNDRRYLPDLFASLDTQTNRNFSVRILDNGSTDDSYAYLREHFSQTVVARNVRNLGFAQGHNQLVRFTLEHLPESELDDSAILIMNPDMILAPDMIERLAEALDADSHVDAVQPKLYRAFGEHPGDETLEETVKSDILDTTGMRVKKGWRMVDRGAGEIDRGQYDAVRDIFCVTGTCALYRATAIRDVLMNGEFYDGEFNTYREDCDLAWRFRAAGHKSAFIPAATAWHYRGMFGAERQSLWKRIINRKGQRPFFAALATRNQLFVLLKNLSLVDLFLSLPRIMCGEGVRVLYGLLFEPKTRKLLLAAFSLVPSMLRKRGHVQASRTEKPRVLRSYVR